MIATVIFGGLGNQMFIYATSRAMSLRLKTPLAINIKQGFKDDILYHRNYELDAFNVKFQESGISSFNIPFAKIWRKLSRIIGFNILAPSYSFFKEKIFNSGIDERILTTSKRNVFLEGYWINPKYFEEYEGIIRGDFTIKCPIPSEVLEEEHKIFSEHNKTPVCIGVRRYQECTDKIKKTMTQTDKDYYLNAMDSIAKEIGNPVFYIFSQDQDWFKRNVANNTKYDIRYIQSLNKRAIDDLYLMTKFKYHIISNSTFYWWGAWLAKSEMVIIPSCYENIKSSSKKWIVIK